MNPVFQVAIYDKSKKRVAVYENIHTINYVDVFGDALSISGDELLTHVFPTSCNLQLLSDGGNYCIDASIIGTVEITRAV